jgi:catabolite regulation protein CreA
MISSCRPQLLDLVAVLRSLPGTDVEVGDVGTVVELLPPDGIEVEFLDRDGRTRCLLTMSIEDVLTLSRKRTPIG